MKRMDVLAVMDGARRTISAQSKLSDDVMAHIADDVAQARKAIAELLDLADAACDVSSIDELRAAVAALRGIAP
jgi:hypothetical protein